MRKWLRWAAACGLVWLIQNPSGSGYLWIDGIAGLVIGVGATWGWEDK